MRGPWPLRRRLVVAVVGLIAALSIIIGTVSTMVLSSYLLDRLDAQLSAAVLRFEAVVGRPGAGSPDGGPGRFLPLAGLPPGTIGAFLDDRGGIDAAILTEDLGSTAVTARQLQLLVDVEPDAAPATLDLGGGLGQYRVLVASDGRQSVLVGIPLSDVTDTVGQLALVIALVTAAGLAIAAVLGTAIVRVALRPLDRVAATASRVAELPLDRGEVALAERVADEDADPATEVGQVGAAINHMLGHISEALTAREASERKVRTFVADASHELRTPLASIRGYAELTRLAGHQLPPDIVRAMSRIESESLRMTSLVEDLLLLARLDDGRELERVPVDLSALLADAVGDAEVAGPDHVWRLAPGDPVVVQGDPARLQQVLLNLLGNARTHTPAGTVVTASVRVDAERAVVTVQDDGPGIPADLQPTLFERFVRGDSSRSRAAGSTGLGLAIVRAVVDAHGGAVSVASEPGRTVFTVLLPLA